MDKLSVLILTFTKPKSNVFIEFNLTNPGYAMFYQCKYELYMFTCGYIVLRVL